MKGSDFCFFHAPDKKRSRKEAQKNGGRGRRKRKAPPTEPVALALDRPGDVRALLSKTIAELQAGKIDHKDASVTGYLASVIIRSFGAKDQWAKELNSIFHQAIEAFTETFTDVLRGAWMTKGIISKEAASVIVDNFFDRAGKLEIPKGQGKEERRTR